MFCKICENFMDITNNVSVPNPTMTLNSNQNGLIGGLNGGLIGGLEPGLTGTEDASSDYDVSSEVPTSRKKKTTTLTEPDIISILDGQDLPFELDNFNINDINKIPYFNKLNSNQKTLVINRLYEKVPKNQKIKLSTETTGIIKDSYFYCKNCGYNEKIPDKMFIFSRSNETNNNDNTSTKFINYKYDNTLPFSKKYNCVNKDCSTHKNPGTKYAVFYRLNNTYTIRYICTVCDSFWSTFVEN